MKTYQTDLPTMFGDHHVREVRRLLLELPGIEEIYASSSFQFLQLDYDESQVKEEEIVGVLEQAGYLGGFEAPRETSLPATEDRQTVFRHTQAFRQTKKVSFHRETAYSGRPLWPCPGMGPVTKVEED
ncbi:MAG: heavy-metal-associated domain-containing protein [Anaerolineales bacterium]|nr:heavy-metal-associated domain-containing protein [Anaerolineales bacterium]